MSLAPSTHATLAPSTVAVPSGPDRRLPDGGSLAGFCGRHAAPALQSCRLPNQSNNPQRKKRQKLCYKSSKPTGRDCNEPALRSRTRRGRGHPTQTHRGTDRGDGQFSRKCRAWSLTSHGSWSCDGRCPLGFLSAEPLPGGVWSVERRESGRDHLCTVQPYFTVIKLAWTRPSA